jgi:hypothetical protein
LSYFCTKNTRPRTKGVQVRYYLHIGNDHEKIPDEEGFDFPDLDTASSYARTSIQDLLAEDVRRGRTTACRHIDITDENGTALDRVALAVTVSWPRRAMDVVSPLSPSQLSSLRQVARGVLQDPICAEDAVHLLRLKLIYRLLGDLRITASGKMMLGRYWSGASSEWR